MKPDSSSALAEMLEAENAALRELDFCRATALLEAKRRVLDLFVTAGAPSAPMPDRLRQAAEENRELLERALLIQRRIIGIVLQAVAPKPPSYAAGGYAAPGSAGGLCVRSTV